MKTCDRDRIQTCNRPISVTIMFTEPLAVSGSVHFLRILGAPLAVCIVHPYDLPQNGQHPKAAGLIAIHQ